MKETLEEAANRILSKEGVKLHPSGLETYLKGNVINAMVEMAKWQQERMYSEEDMIEFAVWLYLEVGSNKGKERTNKELFNKWFEEFKTK